MSNLAAIQDLIRRRAGIAISGPAERLLADSIRARIAATGARDGHEYYLRILSDEGELFHLVELVAINETYFYRDGPQLDFFAQVLAPRLAAGLQKGPFRILSAGCSSGEEVYSIGIALSERFGDEAERLFRIEGCDIDRDALDRARAGVYRSFSFRGMDAARRRRWFIESGESQWRIRDEIARMAEFRRINLLGDEWPEGFDDFDIVFFRNVSIYFDAETRLKMQRRLASIMRPDAYLITGSAETLANDLGVFDLRSEGDTFYFVNSGANADARNFARKAARVGKAPMAKVTPLAASRRISPSVKLETHQSIAEIRALVREKRYDAVLTATDSLASTTQGAEGPELNPLRLLRSFVLLERRRGEEAEGLAMQVLEDDPWSADACVLLGLAARRDGKKAEAIDWFKRAVYADNACWSAHYHLAELYREQGESARAAREYTIVARCLDSQAGRDGGLAVIPLDLPLADLRMVCERRLAEMVV